MGDFRVRWGQRSPPFSYPNAPTKTKPSFADALEQAGYKPQGNPETEADGKVDHHVEEGQTLTGIGSLYDQQVPDLQLTNPEITNPDLIHTDDSLRVLSTERRTSLKTILTLQAELRAAATPEDKAAKEKALRTAVNADLAQAAEHQGFDTTGLKTTLDDRAADLTTLGPKDGDFSRIVGEERQAFEGSLNEMFKPLADKIAAGQKDGGKWPEVKAELVHQFEGLAKDPLEREAAINRARETLRLFGPTNSDFQQAVDDAGREILVLRPAKAIQDAYANGEVPFKGGENAVRAAVKQEDGARKAAQTLREVTAGATPETAILILQEAKVDGTKPGEKVRVVDQIATTIGRRTAIQAGALPLDELGGRDSFSSGEIRMPIERGHKDMLGDLSTVIEHIAEAPQGVEVTNETAKTISKAITDTEQQTFAEWEAELPPEARGLSQDEKKKLGREMGLPPYPEIKQSKGQVVGARDAYQLVVADGQGAGLSAAVISQLKQSGHADRAGDLFAGLIKGVSELKDNTGNAVGDFARDHLVVAADWQNSLTPEQLATALNKSLERNPGSKQAMDQRGVQTVRALSALHAAAPELQGLFGYDRFEGGLDLLEKDEKVSYAVMNSEAAWTEFGRNYLKSTQPEGERVQVSSPPTLYWTGRTIVGMTRAMSAYDGIAGRALYQPPSPGNIDTAARLSPQPTDPKLAQLSAARLATPGAATDPKMRQAAIENLAKAFENSKLDPRNGIVTTSAFGKGLAALQGSLYLASGNDLIGSDNLLYQAFGAWMYGGLALEGSQLGAGAVQNLVQSGHLPPGGFFDRLSGFASVKGRAGWEWFPKYFGKFGDALMVGYTLNYAMQGKWANAGIAGFTTLAGLLAFMKTPKAGPWSAGLSIVGVLGEFIYNDIQKTREAAYYEPQTKQFLIDAGLDPEAADTLADHDDKGNSVGRRMEQVAKTWDGKTPAQLLALLADPKNKDQLRGFVDQVNGVKPNDKGEYPQSAPPYHPPVASKYGQFRPNAQARSIDEVVDWSRKHLKS